MENNEFKVLREELETHKAALEQLTRQIGLLERAKRLAEQETAKMQEKANGWNQTAQHQAQQAYSYSMALQKAQEEIRDLKFRMKEARELLEKNTEEDYKQGLHTIYRLWNYHDIDTLLDVED